jgi:2-polyprenyl-3-methyl-5-hydroxy-6-metoxy-1,4-benzoquinol methylase
MARTPGAGAAERRRRHDVDSFDRRAGSYDRDWRSAFHHAVVTGSAVVAREAVPAPAAILDVGCGTGALLRNLASSLPGHPTMIGVDPAPTMLQVARTEVERAEVGRVLRPEGRLVLVDLVDLFATAHLRPVALRPIFALGPVTIVRAVVASPTT